MASVVTKAREILLRFNNGTDAIEFEPLELNYYTEPISPTGLIRSQGEILLKQRIAGSTETLDPDLNPNGRFNEGVTIECEVGTESFGTAITHPALDGAKIIAKPWLADDGLFSKAEELEIEIGDELAFLDNPAPIDDVSGVDIAGPGQTITATINAYLTNGGTNALINTGPTTVTKRTWQTIDRESRIATAGQIAFGSGVYFIWNDENNQNRIIDYDSAIATPRFTITEAQLAKPLTRIRTSESARRFEKVIARGNLVEVDDCQFGTKTLSEEFATPNQINPVYPDNTTQYLVARDTETTTLSGSVFTSVITKTRLFRVGAPSISTWTNFTSEVITTVDSFNSDGLLSTRVETKQAALLFSALPDELFATERTTIAYAYGVDKTVTSITTTYEKPVIVTGIGLILYVAGQPNRELAFLAKVGRDIETYVKTNCGFDRIVTAVSGDDIVAPSGGTAYQILFTPTKKLGKEPVNRPPGPPTIPRPALRETPIEAECLIFPQNGTPSKIRTTDITLRYVSSQTALQKACEWYARQLFQKAETFRVVMPYLDVIRAATASPNSPFFSFDLQRINPDGTNGDLLRLLWDDVEYVFDQKEALVVVKAQLIARVTNGGATVTPPFSLAVTVAKAEFGFIGKAPGVSPGIPLPPIVVTATKASFGYTGKATSASNGNVANASKGVFGYEGKTPIVDNGKVALLGKATFGYEGKAVQAENGKLAIASKAEFGYEGKAVNASNQLVVSANKAVFGYEPKIASVRNQLIVIANKGSFGFVGKNMDVANEPPSGGAQRFWGIRMRAGNGSFIVLCEELQLRANVGDTSGIATGGTVITVGTATTPTGLFNDQNGTPTGASGGAQVSDLPVIIAYDFGSGNEQIIKEIGVYSAFTAGNSPDRNLSAFDLIYSQDGINWTNAVVANGVTFSPSGGYISYATGF